ncbi:MAG: NAD-dependent epimerase/dehydratase family protein [Myxococcota bacterium]|jgi:UDP-glucuronate 4-epimerase|nr:NAD-dependent epimerase/dehydratase family protein [Myxococcota bacterium]
MKVLVTGAAGFIGSNLCDTLLARGDEVVAVDNFNDFYDPARKRANITGLAGHAGCTLVEADITDAAGMEELVANHRPEAIAHLAAYGNVRYSIGRAPLYTDVNITGSINLLEAARKHDCDRFVFASTSSAYGKTEQLPFEENDPCNHPLAPYPASKKAVEVLGHTYTNLHDTNFTAVRFFSVYGPRGRPDMMPFMVTDRIYRGEEITLFDGGSMKRDWTYIDDIVAGVIAALETPLGYEIINLGRGEPVLMSDFVTTVEELVGKKAILDTPEAPASEPKITFANVDKARRLLGYDPQTRVADGLARLWAWYRDEVAS